MRPYYADDLVTIYHGDCREWMPDADTMTDQPTTAAGRALRDEYPGVWFWEDPRWNGPLGEAIEAEARAPLDVERLVRAFWGMTGKRMIANGFRWPDWDSSESDQYRAQALADGEELAREYAALEEPTP
jgi:hypothetical protein